MLHTRDAPIRADGGGGTPSVQVARCLGWTTGGGQPLGCGLRTQGIPPGHLPLRRDLHVDGLRALGEARGAGPRTRNRPSAAAVGPSATAAGATMCPGTVWKVHPGGGTFACPCATLLRCYTSGTHGWRHRTYFSVSPPRGRVACEVVVQHHAVRLRRAQTPKRSGEMTSLCHNMPVTARPQTVSQIVVVPPHASTAYRRLHATACVCITSVCPNARRCVPCTPTTRKHVHFRIVWLSKCTWMRGVEPDYTHARAFRACRVIQMHVAAWRPARLHAITCVSAAYDQPDARGCVVLCTTTRNHVRLGLV